MMVYRKLMNKLFGWEYAYFRYGFGGEIRRIRYMTDGSEYCIAYGQLITPENREWRVII